MRIEQELFGKTSRGESVYRYVMTNSQGTEVAVLSLGGIIQSIKSADREGRFADVVLGCDTVTDYERQQAYLGAVCGRYANRIRHGKLALDGSTYELACNNGSNHLHGGNEGLNRKIWAVKIEESETQISVVLSYCSPDGEEGYPGNLDMKVRYTLNEQSQLEIDYQAKTDKKTVVNLTNHSYFNLRGYGSCLEHNLQVFSKYYLPTDSTAIPLGMPSSVVNTPMDFRTAKTLGQDISAEHDQLIMANGYDHTLIHNNTQGELVPVAIVKDLETGRGLLLKTTQPSVQLYTGNFLEGTPGRNGLVYQSRDGFCLETQHFPDSPNQPDFPSTELKPGERYHHKAVFEFFVMQ